MTVRLATETDVPVLVEMAGHFMEQVYPGDIVFNPAHVAAFARRTIAAPESDVFVAESRSGALVGMLAMIAYPHPMSGEPIATEICWWVEPSARGIGVRLFHAAERWATAKGAAIFQMIAPSPEVAHFYRRVGFKEIETTYQRRLP